MVHAGAEQALGAALAAERVVDRERERSLAKGLDEGEDEPAERVERSARGGEEPVGG